MGVLVDKISQNTMLKVIYDNHVMFRRTVQLAEQNNVSYEKMLEVALIDFAILTKRQEQERYVHDLY